MRIIQVLAAIAAILAVTLISIASPLAGNALAATSQPVPMPTVQPLTTAAPGTVWYAPDYDAAGNATCPRGQTLLDTENPDVGDSGIVCVATLRPV